MGFCLGVIHDAQEGQTTRDLSEILYSALKSSSRKQLNKIKQDGIKEVHALSPRVSKFDENTSVERPVCAHNWTLRSSAIYEFEQKAVKLGTETYKIYKGYDAMLVTTLRWLLFFDFSFWAPDHNLVAGLKQAGHYAWKVTWVMQWFHQEPSKNLVIFDTFTGSNPWYPTSSTQFPYFEDRNFSIKHKQASCSAQKRPDSGSFAHIH